MAAWNDCLLNLNSWGILSRARWLLESALFFLPLKVFDVEEEVDDEVVVDEIVDIAVPFENDEDVVSFTCCCWFDIEGGNWASS